MWLWQAVIAIAVPLLRIEFTVGETLPHISVMSLCGRWFRFDRHKTVSRAEASPCRRANRLPPTTATARGDRSSPEAPGRLSLTIPPESAAALRSPPLRTAKPGRANRLSPHGLAMYRHPLRQTGHQRPCCRRHRCDPHLLLESREPGVIVVWLFLISTQRLGGRSEVLPRAEACSLRRPQADLVTTTAICRTTANGCDVQTAPRLRHPARAAVPLALKWRRL